jgi:hypothetical protein
MKREKRIEKKERLLLQIGVVNKTIRGITGLLLFSLFPLLFYFVSCDQPFKAGLGPIVDLRIPKIEWIAPAENTYIREVTRFEGKADDDNKLEGVYFQLSSYPTLDLSGEYQPYDHPELGRFYRIPASNIKGNAREWKWFFEIDTMRLENEVRVFPDGDFNIRILARDVVGKENADKAQERPYKVKNEGPNIKVNTPSILPGGGDGALGGERLNFGYLSDPEARKEPFRREMYTGSIMSGLISDNKGIYRGKHTIAVIAEDGDPIKEIDGTPILKDDEIKVDKDNQPKTPKLDGNGKEVTVELFPPQIRFWQVDISEPIWQSGDGKKTDNEGNVMYLAGYFPSEAEVPWAKLNVADANAQTVQFEYVLPDNAGTYWGFEIRAQSEDLVQSSTRYPWDWYNFTGQTDDYKKENSYVLLIVREPTEYPLLELYNLEDIYGDKDAFRNDPSKPPPNDPDLPLGIMMYKDLPIEEQDKKDGRHPYFNKAIVSKGGPFILRLKASHNMNISNVKAYWEKDDRSLRGTFIWDPVDELPWPEWLGDKISAKEPYYKWGRTEPDGRGTKVRNFVFTYTDDPAKDRIDDKDRFEGSFARGRTKVQIYNGSLNFEELETEELEDIKADWLDIDGQLPEGTYNLTIYARSKGGTRIGAPFTATISIDRGPPDVELNYIEGGAVEEINIENDERENKVNGVIQPRFLLSDSRPVDTGFRTGSIDYFRRPADPEKPDEPAGFYSEQAYILISDNQKSDMENYLKDNPWPEFPNLQGAAPVLKTKDGKTTINVWKHGPIIGSACRFKTSEIYYPRNPATETDILPEGDYRLYAFARDNAFNVGRVEKPYLLRVHEYYDYPTMDFGGFPNAGVTEPDSAYDLGGALYGDGNPEKSFIVADSSNSPRNKFNANSVIQVRIKDDDSLDLGQNAATLKDSTGKEVFVNNEPSGVWVSFIGSKPNAAGVIEALSPDSDYLIELSPEEVKAAFPAQSVNPDTMQRIPVKEVTGTINQTVLLKRLKDNPKYNGIFGIKTSTPPEPDDTPPADYESIKNGYNSLPDGIYRIGISVRDYWPAKLIMPTDPRAADEVTVNILNEQLLPPKKIEYFWFAVDSKNPVIEVDFKTEENITGRTKPSGGSISIKTTSDLAGFVYDENGPITLVDWRVVNVDRNPNLSGSQMNPPPGQTVKPDAPRIIITDPALSPAVPPYEKGKWKYEFTYKMDMNGRKEGAYNFELTFQDRFGNKASVSLMYTVDNEPPKVSLTKPIETFSRPMLDNEIDLKPGTYPQNTADAGLNKERLAVKVVNFTVNAVDNNSVTGIRWWLLPWNVSANAIEYTGGSGNVVGNVLDYDAFPSSYPEYKDPGTYYPANGGAYGVVDLGKKPFTIAIDTKNLMTPANGQYRLYIIAVDEADNQSFVTQNTSTNPPTTTSNFFQEVFFLHEEDRPYFGSLDNITPGVVFDNENWWTSTKKADGTLEWHGTASNGANWPGHISMDVRGDNPIVRGTIFENNGFFADGTLSSFKKGSITIWFSDTDTAAANNLPDNWEQLVKEGSDIPNYTRKEIPVNDDSVVGMGRQGRNISLALELAAPNLFPDAFKTDGKKRYIIKATDSPVNKLWYDKTKPELTVFDGVPMGVGSTNTNDESVRVSRWRQFAFVYDAMPPKVEITRPHEFDKDKEEEGGNKFGVNFATEFNLVGSISDANLDTDENGNYYFEYYLDSNSVPRYKFILPKPGLPKPGEPDVTVTYDKLSSDGIPTEVTFHIKPSAIAASRTDKQGIIPQDVFNALAEGQHTLNVFARDKSGKEGAAWVSFTKDTEPPIITFSNIADKDYVESNRNKVDKTWWTPMPLAIKQALLFGNGSTPPLPLTTIYYDNGVPELRGNITDLVSNIWLKTGENAAVGTGDVNISDSAFKYWIDNDGTGAPSYFALIDGEGSKSVRWTINLTYDRTKNPLASDGISSNVLYDGVHTIVLTAQDEPKQEIPEDKRYMIAFRIDSKQPKAAAKASGALDPAVYGNVTYQDPTMFTISLGAQDANLDRAELTIWKKANPEIKDDKEEMAVKRVFRSGGIFLDNLSPPTPAPATPNGVATPTNNWAYAPFGSTAPANPVIPLELPQLTKPGGTLTEDYILFIGTFPVARELFNNVPSGKYDVKVVAYDTFGNKSEEYVWPFIYDKDQPKIVFNNPDKSSPKNDFTPRDSVVVTPPTADIGAEVDNDGILKPNNNINRLTSENLRIQGSVIDTYSAISIVESRVERWIWSGAGAGTWTQVEDWKKVRELGAQEGPPKVEANKSLQISWTKNLLGQNPGDLDISKAPINTDTVNNPLGEGLYRIQIRAKDASFIKNPGSDPWGASGQGNPVVSDYVYFYFDRTNPRLAVTRINNQDSTTMATYYSKIDSGFIFEGTVTDNNRFAKVEVKFVTKDAQGKDVERIENATLTTAAGTAPDFTKGAANRGEATQNWKAEFPTTTVFPDGRYKVTITAYDMTGRSSKEEKSFILDSTPPGMRFTGPAKEKDTVKNPGNGLDEDTPPSNKNFRSVEVQGGVTSVITGETWDKPGKDGESGSESGIDKMWFRLGFIDNNNNFPDKTLVTKDANDLITAAKTGPNATKTDNELMDIVSEADNNAWFRLGGTRKPTGFVINNPNIYDWRMEIPAIQGTIPSADAADYAATLVNGAGITVGTQIGGLKLYGSAITVKGRQYTVDSTPGRHMVQAVPNQAGVYRLPLWVRLVDIAGNVEYYCHDIWIYPDGDIPSTTIESPSNRPKDKARGGTISVDGVAKSNTSVYDVIFRVFADNVSNTNLDGYSSTDGNGTDVFNANKEVGTLPYANLGYIDQAPGTTGGLVKINGNYPAVDATTLAKLPADYRPAGSWGAAGARGTAWQRASLTLTGGAGEPLIPWSIMLNTERQISDYIPTKGFNGTSGTSGANNDRIRVWLEVFVFNGEGAPIRSSIYPNDNLGTGGGTLYGTATAPKPYVRAFYIMSGASKITHPNVGTWTANYKAPVPLPTPAPFARGNFTWNGEDAGDLGGYKGAGTETRSDRFAFSVTLDPSPSGGAGLGEVAYRIKLNGDGWSTWTTVVQRTNGNLPTIPVISNGARVSERDNQAGKGIRYYFDYAVNSKATTPGNIEGGILTSISNERGEFVNWANTGGTITLQVRMKDNSSPPNEAEQTIQVSVDNFAPVADAKSYGNSKVAGSNVDFMGRIYDYASPASPLPTGGLPDAMPKDSEFAPKKLNRVYAWFTKGQAPTTPTAPTSTQYVNMVTGGIAGLGTPVVGAPTTQTLNNVLVGRTITTPENQGGTNDAVSSITLTNRGTTANITFPSNADWFKEISERTAIPGTKMVWNPVNSAVYDVRWSFTLDSTLLPDGDITLHYIVVDEAGNASYYCQPTITVKNKYPVIDRVTLFTDNNGQGAAYTQDDTVEYVINDYRSKIENNLALNPDTTGYLNSGFISKNKFIGFKVETRLGNGPLNFRLQHVTREKKTLSLTTLNEMVTTRNAKDGTKINLYTIRALGDYSSARWKAIGVPIEGSTLPTVGTHFVFNPPDGFNTADYVSTTAEVWKYTLVGSVGKGDIAIARAQGDLSTVTIGGQGDTTNQFAFKEPTSGGNTIFDYLTPASKIGDYNGSHPDYPDSDKTEDDPTKTAFFLIRVWDTVNARNSQKPDNTPVYGSTEDWVNDMLYDAVVVGMNVYLRDTIKPTARLYDLNPYTEIAVTGNNFGTDNQNATIKNAATPEAVGSNIVRGGLFNTNTERDLVKSGYIDPRNGSFALNPKNSDGLPLVGDNPLKIDTDQVATGGATVDKVSGKVILRGLAQDDQLVGEIQIQIGTDAKKTILKLTNGKMVAVAPGGIRDGQPVAFATETLHWKTGHTVEWAYVWDTEREPNGRTGGGPLPNVPIQVSVADEKGPPNTSDNRGTDTNAAPYKNGFSVDIVPYITGFERETPKFNTKRSLQGWYSFFKGEQNVAVRGYNLGQTAGNVTVSISSSASGSTNMTGLAYNGTPENTKNRFYFTIPTSADSGRLNVRVGTTDAYNHTSSHADKSWNREANSYTPGSTLWINKPYAHIWRSTDDNGTPRTYIGTTSSSSGLNHPGMALEYQGGGAGTLHGTWQVYGNANSYYGTNTNNSYPLHTPTPGEPFSTPDISIYQGSGAANIGYTYQGDGRARILIRSNVTTAQGSNTNTGTILLLDSPADGSTQRWQNIRISKAAANNADTETNVGRIYMTAFNADTKGLWFGTRGTPPNETSANANMFIDGGRFTNNSVPAITAAGENVAGNAGQYSAVDYDNLGPIVAYYDGSNDTVRVALGTGSTTSGWTRRYLLPETGTGSELRRGSGRFISIKVDKDNHIHLSFYNSVYNTVVYYYAASRTNIGSAPNGTTVKCHTIDNVITGGTWTDISVDNNGNPWIVYGDSSRTGSYDGARMAYQSSAQTGIRFSGALTCPVTGADITGWEALTMPANYTVGNDRLNIEAWPPTGRGGTPGAGPGWNAAIGYTSDLFRVGYFFYPAWKGYGSNTVN